MSVLTDPECVAHPLPHPSSQSSLSLPRSFLLHTLQLSYLRHVLPNHAALSNNAPGGGGGGGPSAYSLIAFPPPADLAAANPYLALSGTTDPHRWPELATTAAHAHEGQHQSGRSSPPLAPLLTREAGASRRGGAGAARPWEGCSTRRRSERGSSVRV